MNISISKFYCNENFLLMVDNKIIISKQSNYSRAFEILLCREFEGGDSYKCLNMIISTPRFPCIICDKTLKCDHQDKKNVTDHIDTPNHKSMAAARKNQTEISFSLVLDDTILQKVR